MGRGRARAAAVGVLGVLALVVSGCGAETHPNEQRPQVPIRASITITPKAVTVQPAAIGVGPARTQQIPQNQNHPQPPIKSAHGPLIVVLVAANQTTTDSRLEIRGPRDIHSGPIFAHSSGTFQTALPTGHYVIAAANIPGARAAKLTVGPYRASSQNDVLLP